MSIGLTIAELQGLDAPVVIEELDFEALLQQRRDGLVARFPAIENVIDLESEPARMLLEEVCYGETLLRARVNDAARARLLAYAGSSDLDHVAAFYDLTRLAGETDDAFRRRTVLAIQGRSTGGTAPRYRLVALSADVRVRDAIAYLADSSPAVTVAIFATDNGGIADTELLETVDAALQDPAVRMVNDTILVRSAVTGSFDVTANMYLLPQTSVDALDAARQALIDGWAAHGGLDVNVTIALLTSKLMVPGIQRVEIVEPASDILVEPHEALTLGTVTLTLAGRDY